MNERGWPTTVGLLLFISFLAILGLFLVDTWPTAVDWSTHFYWTNQFRRSLDAGVCHPRWVEPSHGGYGSPAFLFYPPVVYYLSALATYVTPSDIWALRLVNMLFFFLGAGGTYLLCHKYLSKDWSLFGAALFTLLPGHLYLLYGDWLFANLSMMALLPWLLLGLLSRGRYLTFVWSLSLLTHTMTAILAVPWLLLFSYWADEKNSGNEKWIHLKHLFSALVIGTLIASFYLLPVAYHLSEIRQDVHLAPSWGSADQNVLFTVDNPRADQAWPMLNWYIGIVQVLQFGVLVGGALVIWPKWRAMGAKMLAALAITSFLLMMRPAAFFWRAFPFLGRMLGGLPWRLAPPLTLLAASICVVTFSQKEEKTEKRHMLGRLLVACCLLLSFLCSLSLYYLANSVPVSAEDLEIARQKSHWSVFEYRSKHAPHLKEYKEPWEPKIEVVGDNVKGKVAISQWLPERRGFNWISTNKGQIKVRLYHFPGWSARYKKGDTWQDLTISRDEDTGGMLLELPVTTADGINVEITYGPTSACYWGYAVSLVGLMAAVIFLRKRQ